MRIRKVLEVIVIFTLAVTVIHVTAQRVSRVPVVSDTQRYTTSPDLTV
jgi:cadmium resistance protein CadD (predicted permease)